MAFFAVDYRCFCVKQFVKFAKKLFVGFSVEGFFPHLDSECACPNGFKPIAQNFLEPGIISALRMHSAFSIVSGFLTVKLQTYFQSINPDFFVKCYQVPILALISNFPAKPILRIMSMPKTPQLPLKPLFLANIAI